MTNQALCVAVEDDDPTAGCNQITACLCGVLLRAERLGNMPVLLARRVGEAAVRSFDRSINPAGRQAGRQESRQAGMQACRHAGGHVGS